MESFTVFKVGVSMEDNVINTTKGINEKIKKKDRGWHARGDSEHWTRSIIADQLRKY